MNIKRARRLLVAIFILLMAGPASPRNITFCGEGIPVDNSFVAQRLMNVIRRQIPAVNLPQLRRQADQNFPMIEYYLKATNMPRDLKYIPIVESGFTNATSKAGAQGFWQLMPATAQSWGLQVNRAVDERNDPHRATIAAIQELASLYKQIRKKYNISSWVLTAAAYNYGIGNMFRNINAQGKNYFSMNLNPETALYVYKIVAVKELFEYPEIYIRNFQYNVFKYRTGQPAVADKDAGADDTVFKSVNVTVQTNDGAHPDDFKIKGVPPPTEADLKKVDAEKLKEARLVSARLRGDYKTFNDGDSIYIQLEEALASTNSFKRSGTVLKGRGWIIGERIFVDLGFGNTEVILYDAASRQGISLAGLKDNEQLLLRVEK